MKVCHRCQKEVESVYCVPYVYESFLNIHICQECSIDFHKDIKRFASEWLCVNPREVKNEITVDIVYQSE